MNRGGSLASETIRLRDDLEELWGLIDQVFESFGAADWQRKHGRDWIFADVPYHLSYFDREIVALPIERGPEVPPDVPRDLRTMADLNRWNAEWFARRAEGQTPERSVVQMKASRDHLRRLLSGMTDADLDTAVFSPLPGFGWVTARLVLQGCVAHSWNHLTQLRLNLNRTAPIPSPRPERDAIAFYMHLLPAMMNTEEAAKGPFTAVMEFTGAGGSAWTYRVAGGRCAVAEGRAADADFVMTQRPETFVKTLAEMHNPMFAMLTGEIKVKGILKMMRFGKLFPPPKPATVLQPIGAGK